MVDAPKENNDNDKEDPVEDKPSETQSKRRRQRHRSKSRRSRDGNTSTGEDDTLEGAEDNEDPIETANEQDEWEDGQASPGKQATHKDSEDGSYLPLSKDEVSLGTDNFVVAEEPLEQERFKCRLIATARSLKKKQQQLQVDQDLLNDKWTDVLAAEEYSLKRPTKSYPKCKFLP